MSIHARLHADRGVQHVSESAYVYTDFVPLVQTSNNEVEGVSAQWCGQLTDISVHVC